MYDPALGRWHTPDPLADEVHNLSLTPYHYANNNPIAFVDLFGLDWFYYQKEGEDEEDWHWREDKGTYTHSYTYTDKDGNEKTGNKELQGYEMLAVYEITGENEEGAATGTVTLYGEGYDDVLESSPRVFTGGVGSFEQADLGNYLMDFGLRDASGPAHLNRAGDNPLSYLGAQKIIENGVIEWKGSIYSNSNVIDAYGFGRVRLQPTQEMREYNLSKYGYADRGLYLHGKRASLNSTHGCVGDKSEKIFDYLWNNSTSVTPFQIKNAP